jgi:hypothetical protein
MSGFRYVDGVGNVSVINGMVHIDLLVARPQPGNGQQQVQAEEAQHLVMALPQFVRLCAEMAGHLGRMEQKGLITRRPADTAAAAAPPQQPAPRPITRQPAPPASEPAPAKRGGFFWKK